LPNATNKADFSARLLPNGSELKPGLYPPKAVPTIRECKQGTRFLGEMEDILSAEL